MRLPEAKIKEALVHPDKLVRQEALLYFADCYSRDAEVMPLAIQAIETYGRSQAFLHRGDDKANDLDSYFPALWSSRSCTGAGRFWWRSASRPWARSAPTPLPRPSPKAGSQSRWPECRPSHHGLFTTASGSRG
jgi:hypothetical protein